MDEERRPNGIGWGTRAPKAAGGQWDDDLDGAGTQLRFARGTPDFRWAGYCLKRVCQSPAGWRRFMRQYGSPLGYAVGFEGKAVMASENLKIAAIEQYETALATIGSGSGEVAPPKSGTGASTKPEPRSKHR